MLHTFILLVILKLSFGSTQCDHHLPTPERNHYILQAITTHLSRLQVFSVSKNFPTQNIPRRLNQRLWSRPGSYQSRGWASLQEQQKPTLSHRQKQDCAHLEPPHLDTGSECSARLRVHAVRQNTRGVTQSGFTAPESSDLFPLSNPARHTGLSGVTPFQGVTLEFRQHFLLVLFGLPTPFLEEGRTRPWMKTEGSLQRMLQLQSFPSLHLLPIISLIINIRRTRNLK